MEIGIRLKDIEYNVTSMLIIFSHLRCLDLFYMEFFDRSVRFISQLTMLECRESRVYEAYKIFQNIIQEDFHSVFNYIFKIYETNASSIWERFFCAIFIFSVRSLQDSTYYNHGSSMEESGKFRVGKISL